MRSRAFHAALLAAAVAVLSWDAHAAEDATAEAPLTDLDDFDDDDEQEGDEDAAGAAGGAALAQVEDVDSGRRMKACFLYTMRRAKVKGTKLQENVQEMMTTQKEPTTPEQALNTIIFSWMMTCFMNIDEKNMKTAYTADTLDEAVEQEVFIPKSEDAQEALSSPAAKSLEAGDGYLVKEMIDASKSLSTFVTQHGMGELTTDSRRQWEKLEKVLLQDTQKKGKMPQQQQQQQSYQSSSQSYQSTTGGSSAEAPKQQFGMMYVLGAFGAIFGLSALVVLRLNGTEEKSTKEKSSKSLRKEEKAKREMARKQR